VVGWRNIDGEKLKRLRSDRMLSQLDLMERTGLSQATISNLERGVRCAQPRTVRRLAEALNVEAADLLREDG
jgi:transcriptional regulator with XRE-family HTH domain